jgi:hypothetical protein
MIEVFVGLSSSDVVRGNASVIRRKPFARAPYWVIWHSQFDGATV